MYAKCSLRSIQDPLNRQMALQEQHMAFLGRWSVLSGMGGSSRSVWRATGLTSPTPPPLESTFILGFRPLYFENTTKIKIRKFEEFVKNEILTPHSGSLDTHCDSGGLTSAWRRPYSLKTVSSKPDANCYWRFHGASNKANLSTC